MTHFIKDAHTVSRGDLTAFQIMTLDATLVHHGEPESSPHRVHPTLAYACLKCRSIGLCKTSEARDDFVDNMDVQCCGLTVVFHSTDACLVDPSVLVVRPAKDNKES